MWFYYSIPWELQYCTPGLSQRRGSARSNWWLLSMQLMIGLKWPSPRNDHLWPYQRATETIFNLQGLTAAFLLEKYGKSAKASTAHVIQCKAFSSKGGLLGEWDGNVASSTFQPDKWDPLSQSPNGEDKWLVSLLPYLSLQCLGSSPD